MPLPDFLIIGAQKCATTTLAESLGRHPGVLMSSPKEPHFFSLDSEYAKGLDHYRRNFENAAGRSERGGVETGAGSGNGTEVAQRRCGEASTSYSMYPYRPDAAERIAQHLPEARLIYIVRHPLRRIESAYMHSLIYDRSTLDFQRAIETDPNLINNTRYWQQIGRFRDRFPDDRILVLFTEDLEKDPEQLLRTVCRFLELDPPPRGLYEGRRHVSLGEPVDGPLLRALRRWPLTSQILQSLPKRLRGGVLRSLSRRLEARPDWSPDLVERVSEALREDAQQLLSFYGKSPGFWTWR